MFHDKQKQTCGPLYQKQLDYYAKGDPFLMRAFAAGFVTGEAEKIYLGACAAAMFRPSKQHLDTLFRIALKASETYELSIRVLNCPDETEIWLFFYDARVGDVIGAMEKTGRNTPTWHALRGVLTGVPLREIDCEFHLRTGHGEPCDNLR